MSNENANLSRRELLRALGQSIELMRVHATGYDKIPSAFGRTLEQNRSLNLQEIACRQELANKTNDPVTQDQVCYHTRSP